MKTILWELPRYNREFEQHADGSISSKDFTGYDLASCQQLVAAVQSAGSPGPAGAAEGYNGVEYSLPNFEQHLLLSRAPNSGALGQARRSDMLVLVPVGGVRMGKPSWNSTPLGLAAVHVDVAAAIEAKLQVSGRRVKRQGPRTGGKGKGTRTYPSRGFKFYGPYFALN